MRSPTGAMFSYLAILFYFTLSCMVNKCFCEPYVKGKRILSGIHIGMVKIPTKIHVPHHRSVDWISRLIWNHSQHLFQVADKTLIYHIFCLFIFQEFVCWPWDVCCPDVSVCMPLQKMQLGPNKVCDCFHCRQLICLRPFPCRCVVCG